MEKLTLNQIVEELQKIYPNSTTAWDYDYEGTVVEFADYGLTNSKLGIPEDYEPIPEGISDWQVRQGRYEANLARRNKWLNENHVLGGCVEMDSGGGPNAGSDWWKVYHFTKHDVYLKVSGYYQSYEGLEIPGGWNACREVFPKEVMVTIYVDEKEKVS